MVPWSTQGTIQRKPAVIHSYPWSIRPQIQLSVLKKFFFSSSLKGVQFLAGITTFQYTDSLTDLFQLGPLSLGKKPCPSHFANPLSLMHAGEAQCSLGQLAGRSYISTHYIPSPSKITIKQQLHLHLCLSELQTWAVAGDIRRLNLISGLAISRISALSGLDFRFTLWRDSMEASFSTGTSVARQRRARKRHRISTCKNRCQKIQLNMILAVHFVKLVKT